MSWAYPLAEVLSVVYILQSVRFISIFKNLLLFHSLLFSWFHSLFANVTIFGFLKDLLKSHFFAHFFNFFFFFSTVISTFQYFCFIVK